MKLTDLELFVKIIEKNGLAAAGRELNLSAATVSERLAALEAHYGATLIHRTTRALKISDEGKVLLDSSRRILEDVESLDTRIRFGDALLSGLIRISAPIDLGRTIVSAVIDDFLKEHQQIRIELILKDSYVNIVDEGIDIAIRFGELSDSTLRVRNLAANTRIVCAAPSYLDTHGTPTTPEDLNQHNCIVMRFGSGLDNLWTFSEGKQLREVAVSGNRIANDGSLAHQWCLEGHGILLKSIWDVGHEIQSGQLVRLLKAYSPPPTHVRMVFPPSRNQPLRVRRFADALIEKFTAHSINKLLQKQ